MTFLELWIQLDLNPDNRANVLKNADTCRKISIGYLFVDQEDGQCYLFDEDGNLDNIRKVKLIGYKTFFDCKSLTSIKIPDTVKSIGEWAFYNCEHLTSIEIPNSVKWIGYRAFYRCTSLTSIKIPDSNESIVNYVFEDCISLTSIEIPNSVKSIGNLAFCNCKSLTSIKIPSSVKLLGDWAFICCPSLKEVVFEGKTMKQVKAMYGYPWRIIDESVIKTES